MTDDDQQLWAALVAAEQQRVRHRAEFYQHARSRGEVLAAALRGSHWDRSTALDFIQHFPDHAAALLDQLIEHTLYQRWALAARQAIAPAWRAGRLPELPDKVIARLRDADYDEYRRLAELLMHIQAWDTLHTLVTHAGNSADPDTREVAEDFGESCGQPSAEPANDSPTP